MRGSKDNKNQGGSLRRMRDREIQETAIAPAAGGRPEPVPTRAVVNARHFLWDEDEEEYAPGAYTQAVLGASMASIDRPSLPGYGSSNMGGVGGRVGVGGVPQRSSLFDPRSVPPTSSRALSKAVLMAPPGYPLDESTVKPIKVPKKDKSMKKTSHFQEVSATSRNTASTWSQSIRGFFSGGSEDTNLVAPPIQGGEPSMQAGYPVPQGYPREADAFLSAFQFEDESGGFSKSVRSTLSSLGTSIRHTLVSANLTSAPPLEHGSEDINYETNFAQGHIASSGGADALTSDVVKKHMPGPGSFADSPGNFAACCTSAVCGLASRRRTMYLVAAAAIIASIAIIVVTNTRSNSGGQPSPIETIEQSSSAPTLLPTTLSNNPQPVSAPTVLIGRPIPAPTVLVGGLSDQFASQITSSPTLVENSTDLIISDRLAEMKDRILSSGMSDVTLLDMDNTPQNRALKWISYSDSSSLDRNDEFVLQRYSLAVFYFSSHTDAPFYIAAGEGWADTTNWMTSKGYCSWFGIKCHPKEGTDSGEKIYDGNGDISHFNLTKNNVRGTMPSEIAALEDLVVLDLGENGIFSTIPEEIGSLGSLRTLYLGDNEISGTVPTTLGMLSQCTHLYLDNNTLEGTIPTEFGELTNIHMLGLYGNKLTGPVPDFSNMKDLRDLYLDSNELSGQLPASLGALKSLTDLRLGSNSFQGSIPPEICDLANLSTLYLEDNMLTGTFPMQIWNLRNLVELQVYENFLTGNIPFEFIGLLKKLEVLYLDGNEFSGTIAPSIANCKELTQLFLNDNYLSGSIPSEIEQLSKLNRLYLQNNHLEGEIPGGIGGLVHLEKVHLHSNNLSGAVPLDICSLMDHHDLVELLRDCSVACDCCTQCF